MELHRVRPSDGCRYAGTAVSKSLRAQWPDDGKIGSLSLKQAGGDGVDPA